MTSFWMSRQAGRGVGWALLSPYPLPKAGSRGHLVPSIHQGAGVRGDPGVIQNLGSNPSST